MHSTSILRRFLIGLAAALVVVLAPQLANAGIITFSAFGVSGEAEASDVGFPLTTAELLQIDDGMAGTGLTQAGSSFGQSTADWILNGDFAGFGATAAVASATELGLATASSSFFYQIDFQLTDVDYMFSYAADVSGSGGTLDSGTFGFATVILTGFDTGVLSCRSVDAEECAGFSNDAFLSGLLAPGSYTLLARTQTSALAQPAGGFGAADTPLTASARTDFNLTLTPVPEPSSMLLLGTGLAGVVARSWRKRRTDKASRA